MALTTNPLSDVMGAEITGIDLSQPLDEATKHEINQVFLDHQILCFRDQSFDIPGFLDAGETGELTIGIVNNEDFDLTDVSVSLSSESALVEVLSGPVTIDRLRGRLGSARAVAGARFTVAADVAATAATTWPR